MNDPTMNSRDPFREQYERWVTLYGPELHRYAYGLTANASRAEDLLQDTFAEAWSSVSSLREKEKVRAWLFQIMRYRFSRMQRQGRSPRKTVDLPDEMEQLPMTEARSPLEDMALRESLENSLLKLSPDVRRTFLMVFLEELTCRETASILGIPIGTVLSRLDAARRSLRNAIAAAEAKVSRNHPAAQWNRNGNHADTDTPSMNLPPLNPPPNKPPAITPKSGRRL